MRRNEKNEIKPWLVKEWCIPKAGAEFVAAMEDVLEVYQRPYDPLRPVVCIDETNLYKAFKPEEARRLAERFEWHYTPKHGSRLNMAEIETGVMSRQALAKPLPDMESFEEKIRIWKIKRNTECKKINWQFKTTDARIKLAKLYPSVF